MDVTGYEALHFPNLSTRLGGLKTALPHRTRASLRQGLASTRYKNPLILSHTSAPSGKQRCAEIVEQLSRSGLQIIAKKLGAQL